MHREAIGNVMAKLHAKQQTGSVDEIESMPVGFESHDATAWTHRILVTSNHVLFRAKNISENILLDLSTRREEIEARITMSRCDML
jgi:hypothetical protein